MPKLGCALCLLSRHAQAPHKGQANRHREDKRTTPPRRHAGHRADGPARGPDVPIDSKPDGWLLLPGKLLKHEPAMVRPCGQAVWSGRVCCAE
eukprot:scaffold115120_cov70-Phaeocystis_antarctica.AAC.3